MMRCKMEEKKVKAALLGLGTVGTGVYKLIHRRADVMERTIGAELEIARILVHNMNKKREGVDSAILTDNWREILEDDEIAVVVEVMGGIEPARTMILEALHAGKHVVTANKDLVAEYGRELLDAAEEKQCDFLFEAAVAGGIPIIRPLKQCLAGNDISEVIGIVNGTTNYILTKMFEDNMSFESALAKATELGYAEADPTADVEGLDAGRKVAIMASIAFHSRVVFKDVYTEGITRITAEDIAYAKEFDSVIKLLGVAHNRENGIEVGVYPMLLNKEHPLASVRDSFNAVFVHGDAVDDAMFYGRGAGELPTASAVVGDIIDVARDLQYACTGRISCTCYRELPVKDFGEVKNKFFLRMQVKNQPGVLACIAQVFGDHKVSIARVVQKHVTDNQAELVIVTEKVKEYHLQDALRELKEMESILEISSVIREY
ncbi:homoserine dehydrogenase [Clostridium sp. D5]|nr:homoserine dehydrogenase [Clostridium sp. D5]